MLALAAAVVFLLLGLGAIEPTQDVDWLLIAVAFWAGHFGLPLGVPSWPWQRRS